MNLFHRKITWIKYLIAKLAHAPCLEAMASQVPVIATQWGGHLEFIDNSNNYLIRVDRMVPVDVSHMKWYDQNMRWAKPSLSHLRELMRHVYENPGEAKDKAPKARKDVIEKWRWSTVEKIIYDRLMEVWDSL